MSLTNEEIIDNIAGRMRDTNYKKFLQGQDAYIAFVQRAQYAIATYLKNQLLLDIETSSAVTLTAGVGTAPLSSILKGVEGVTYFKDTARGVIGKYIIRKDIKQTENKYLSGSKDTPIAYILKKQLIVDPASIAAITLFHLGFPTATAYNSNEPDLNGSLHQPMEDLGLSFAKLDDKQFEASQELRSMVYSQLNSMNARVKE